MAGAAALPAEEQQPGGTGRARVGLCVLCGLPAAGKSTLARALRRRLPQRPGWACALLTYDELIPPEAFGPREAEVESTGPPPLVSAIFPSFPLRALRSHWSAEARRSSTSLVARQRGASLR